MRILLACNGGMSTSLIVTKMKNAAESKGAEHTIWAVAADSVAKEVGNFDVLLLGPQIVYLKNRLSSLVGDAAPIAMIAAQHYGMCNGEAILKQAEDVFEEFKKGKK